jgi:hypothetical protein
MSMANSLLSELVGSWKLVSGQFKMSDNGEIIIEHPHGFCTFDSNGRWTAVSVRSGQKKPETDQECADLFNHMVAFSGRCRTDGAGIVVTVDAAWNPAFTGAELHRTVDIRDDRLTIAQPEWEHPFFPGRKTIVTVYWERETG